MTKQTNIFNKLKANLKVLLPVCFALMISVGSASAEPTYQISEADIVGQISQTPSGNSQVFRQQPDNSTGGSTAFDREVRQFKRALNNSLTGQGHGLGTYAKSLVGDGLNAGLNFLDEGLTNIFSSVESSLPNGWIKDLLVTYNPVYQVTKFASKAVVKIAKFATGIVFGVSNRECNKERMDAIYKSGCYACDVVTALIGSFMNACTYLYDVAKEAGSKILWVGVMLWVAFYVLQQLSSLKNLEPSAMVNELLIMAFKVLGAYRLLVHPGPNASPSYLALNMAGVILLSWIISYVYATWIRQKIARYDRIRPDMEPGEVLLAGSAATYGLYDGRLVLTDRRLIFVGSIFGKKKTVFALPSASVAALDPSGRYGLRLTTTEGRKLTFRLAQASSSLRHAFVRTAHENSL